MDWVTGAMAMVLAMEGATMVATVATMASVLLMLSPRLMLTPTTMEAMVWDTEAMAMVAMDWATGAMAMVLAMEGATMVATMATMASVMLMLSLLLLLSPRLMLIPTTMEDMVWDTGAMVAMDWATEAMAMVGYGRGYYGGYRGYYGKRDADAEPKADADPYYYGGYGLGYRSYGYGGYGLGYGYGLYGR